MLKNTYSLLILLTSTLLFSNHSVASPLGYFFSPSFNQIYAEYVRYEFDGKKGDLKGPFRGSMTLKRPYYLIVNDENNEINLDLIQKIISYSTCDKCQKITFNSDRFLSEPLLGLFRDGSSIEGFINPKNESKFDNGLYHIQYLLTSLGYHGLEASIWSYEAKPTSFEVSRADGTKTIIQLTQIKTQVNQQETVK